MLLYYTLPLYPCHRVRYLKRSEIVKSSTALIIQLNVISDWHESAQRINGCVTEVRSVVYRSCLAGSVYVVRVFLRLGSKREHITASRREYGAMIRSIYRSDDRYLPRRRGNSLGRCASILEGEILITIPLDAAVTSPWNYHPRGMFRLD